MKLINEESSKKAARPFLLWLRFGERFVNMSFSIVLVSIDSYFCQFYFNSCRLLKGIHNIYSIIVRVCAICVPCRRNARRNVDYYSTPCVVTMVMHIYNLVVTFDSEF